jgi:hypothetical protein
VAFGKRSLQALPEEFLEQIEENRVDCVVHKTEVKILATPPAGTPLGDIHLVEATEAAMSETALVKCLACKEMKNDIKARLTGRCEACWALIA